MNAKYTVIQFSPNPLSGEKINIGVLAFDQNGMRARFLDNWARVRRFAGEEVDFLKGFAEQIQESVSPDRPLPGLSLVPQLTEHMIVEMAAKWTNSIQLTQPRSSLQPIDKLIESISAEVLTQPIQKMRAYRDRRQAATIARACIRRALEETKDKVDLSKLAYSAGEVIGRFGPHTFDSVVANGTAKLAVHAVSFELPLAIDLDRLVDSIAFQLYDVRERLPKLPIGILVLPPRSGPKSNPGKIYDRARRIYNGLKTDVITEDEAVDWMREKIKHISFHE